MKKRQGTGHVKKEVKNRFNSQSRFTVSGNNNNNNNSREKSKRVKINEKEAGNGPC